jgi:hypothetical protein
MASFLSLALCLLTLVSSNVAQTSLAFPVVDLVSRTSFVSIYDVLTATRGTPVMLRPTSTRLLARTSHMQRMPTFGSHSLQLATYAIVPPKHPRFSVRASKMEVCQ